MDLLKPVRSRAVTIGRTVAASGLAAAALFLLPAAAQAATYTVTKTADTADGVCDSDCSLREAIIAANANPGHDTINVPPGTYTLTLTGSEGPETESPSINDLDILEGVTLVGTGADPSATIIQAAATRQTAPGRVIMVMMDGTGGKDVSTTIQNVTIRNGYMSGATGLFHGGGVDFYGATAGANLHLLNDVITQNGAGAHGGGLAAGQAGAVSGVYVWVDHTAIINNIAGDQPTLPNNIGGSGGAILVGGNVALKIDDSLLQGNISHAGNSYASGQGGAIFAFDDTTSGVASYIRNTVIDGNTAIGMTKAGAGGAFIGRPVTITNSTISNNVADDYGGGLVLSEINGYTATLGNVTISGNTTKTYGGGIYISNGGTTAPTFNFVNLTVTNNRADSDGVASGEPSGDTGGGIRRQTTVDTGNFNIYNTIVAGNFKGTGSTADDIQFTGMSMTGTNNLTGTGGSGGLNAGTNQTNVATPHIGPLANNGNAARSSWLGTLQTHALQGDSVALDGGDATKLTAFGLNLTTDERGTGWTRQLDAADANATAMVDIGALEMHPSVADTGALTMLQDTTNNTYQIYVGDNSLGIDSVTATSSNTSILPNPTVTGTGATRTLTLAPLAGKSGTVTVTLTSTDLYNGVTQSMTDSFTVTIVPRPDLTVTKTHTNGWKQGDTGKTYTLTVSNLAGAGPTLGTGNAFGIDPTVTVVDTLPAGLTATAINGTGWTCTLATLTCTRSDVLNAGSSYPTITVTVTVADNANPSVTNNVTVSGNADNTPGNNSAPDPTTLIQTPDLTVAKSHSGNFQQGQSGATYTLTVNNGGLNTGATLSSYSVTETLPAGITFVSGTSADTGWNCSAAGQVVTCTRSTALPSPGSTAITVTVNVARDAATPFNSTATVSGGGEVGSRLANDTSAADPITVDPMPDLTLTKSPVGTFRQGQDAVYTITVNNSGFASSDGTAVTVTDTLPAGLTYVSGTGLGWSCSAAGQTVTCTNAGTAGAGGAFPAITLNVHVADNAAASVTNTASVTGGGQIWTANDSASAPTTVVQAPDLTITKSHTGNFTQGETNQTYTITVANKAGKGPTFGDVTVTDTLPADLTLVSMSGSNWDCTAGTSCTRSDALLSGSSFEVITVTVNVAGNAPSSVTNSASVSGGSELSSTLTDNTANDVTTVIQLPDPTIAISHTDPFAQGDSGDTYTLTVTNLGTGPTSGTLTVTEAPPAGLTITGMSGTNWTCATSAPWTCSRSDALAGSASYEPITVTVDVATNAAATVTNTVTIAGGGDVNTGNNTDSDVTTVTQMPDLTVTMSDSGDFRQGGTSTYTITVSNSGYAGTNGTVTVTDTLPAGMTAAAMGGTGWSCNLATGTCTNDGTAAAGGGFPPVTLTVNVAPNAGSPLTNSVSVSGGGEQYTANNTAPVSTPVADVNFAPVVNAISAQNSAEGNVISLQVTATDIDGDTITYSATGLPDGLSINPSSGLISGTLTYTSGGAYTVTVTATDPGSLSDSKTFTWNVTNTNRAPAFTGDATNTAQTINEGEGLTALAASDLDGDPISFTLVSGALPAGISLNGDGTFTGTASASASGTYSVTISVSDGTLSAQTTLAITVNNQADLSIAKSHTGAFYPGQTGATYTIVVGNAANAGSTVGTVTVTDTLPADFTATAISGTGWTCTVGTLTCTRSDALAPGASYPAITVTVDVNPAAGTSATNVASVSGGGDVVPDNNSSSDPTSIQILTTTTVSAVTDVYGASVTLTATVSPAVAGDVAFTVDGTAAGTAPVNAGVATVSYTIAKATGAYTIGAAFTPSSTQYRSSSGTGTLTVNPKAIMVKADDVAVAYGTAPTFTYTATGLVGSDTLNGITCDVTGAHSDVGTYTINCSQSAGSNPNYTLTFQTGTLTVNPKAITVKADDVTVTYGDTPTFTYTATGLVGSDSLSGITCDVTGAHSNAGTYTISCSQSAGSNPNYAVTFQTGTLTVSAYAATVKANDVTVTYGDTPSFTYASTGLLGSDTLSGITCDVAGAHGNAGTYTINCTQAPGSNPNYAITFQTGTLTVSPKAATVKADDVTFTYGTAPTFTFTATGLVGSDALSGITCDVSGAHANVGSYTIACSQSVGSNPNYAITFQTGALSVNPKPITVKADDVTVTYGATPSFTFTATGLVGSDTLNGITCDVAGAHSDVGTYTVTCSQSAGSNPNYTITFQTGTLTVSQFAATVKADDVTITYGDATPTFTYTATGLVGSDTLSGITCDVTGAHSNAGTYTITCSQSASSNPNYTVTFQTGTLTVNPKAATVKAADVTITYGDAPAFTYTATGLLGGDALNGITCDVAGAHGNAGTYTITCTQTPGSNPNYAITFQTGTLTVNPKAATVKADDVTFTYGMAPTFTFTATGLVGSDALSGITCAVSGAHANVGSYTISCTQSAGSNLNYAITFQDGTLTVTQAPLTVRADDKSKVYGNPNPDFTVTYGGFVLGETESVLGGTHSVTTTATDDSPVGTYPITPAGYTSDNYTITFVPGTLTVMAGPTPDLTVTLTHDGTFTQGGTATYKIRVSDVGAGATYGPITVTDTLPAGLTYGSASGADWTCQASDTAPRTITCTRTAMLSAGASTDITLTVAVAGDAAPSLTNSVQVSGGGEENTANNTASDSTEIVQLVDLSITKTHEYNFTQGQKGATYRIAVANNGIQASNGTVTVKDTVPSWLTIVDMDGVDSAPSVDDDGWTCDKLTGTCTTTNTVAPGAKFPEIIVTVDVDVRAPETVTNAAEVSGGGDYSPANNQASDDATVIQVADLTIAKSHTGSFRQGEHDATFTLVVSNVGNGPTAGTVTVTDTLPAGFTATYLDGDGWDCDLGSLTCYRSDVLTGGSNPAASYPPITLKVDVNAFAPTSLTNRAAVSGGGQVIFDNDQNTDTAAITPVADLTLTKSHRADFVQGHRGIYTLLVRNEGQGAADAAVTVTDTLPAGMTAASMAGDGWTCDVATVACTRSDELAPGASYPPIALTVAVDPSATGTLTNTAVVAGGGEANFANDSASDPTRIVPPGSPPPPPFVTITAPAAVTNQRSITVHGTATPGATISVNGSSVHVGPGATWSATVELQEGPNVITATNGTASDSVTVTLDTVAPPITLTASETQTDKETVELTATSEAGASITIDGRPGASQRVRLELGANTFTAVATDPAGNTATATVTVVRVQPNPPGPPSPPGPPVPPPVEPPVQPPVPPPAPHHEAPFKDVEGHWAVDAIARMVDAGVVTGYEDKTFRPEAEVSRLEFAVMVTRLLKLAPVDQQLSFTDAGSLPGWSRAQVAAAVQAGIITGRPDGTFDPTATVTRAEVAVMLVRALSYRGMDVTPGSAAFTDLIPDWARAQVLAAARYGLVNGYDDGSFQPGASATRAEAATMLSRLLDVLSR